MDLEKRVESLEITVNKLLDLLYDHYVVKENDDDAENTRVDLLKLQNEFNGTK